MRPEYYDAFSRVEDQHWWFRGRRAVIAALLARAEVPPQARLLDAGCGTGRNLLELDRIGDATGVDSAPAALELARRRGLERLVEAPVERLPFADESFDLILAADVIEHADDDRVALAELARVAEDDGRLLLTVPAYPRLWSRHDELVHHRRRYTRRTLVEAVREAGWQPSFTTHFNTLLLPPMALVRVLRRHASDQQVELALTPSRLDGALSLPLRIEAALIGRGLRLPAGLSIGLLARRRI